jgi:exosortase/archaeosortase family protein
MGTAMGNVLSTSATGRWLGRFEAMPPLAWLALQAVALWPHWRWAAARLADGSDDPLGLVSAAVLIGWVAWQAQGLRGSARPAWWTAAGALTVLATVSTAALPPLAGALLAALALACGWRAIAPSGQAALPLAGLAVLSLPVVSSLQFYAGFPLRLVTAQCSTWLLQLAGRAAERSGTAMVVDGQLVIVDAPCSGVQMVWMAYFCACAVALLGGLRERSFVRRLPAVGALVLCGNVLRNTVLVALESRGPLAEAWHQGIGLAVLAMVCAAVVRLMKGVDDAAPQ